MTIDKHSFLSIDPGATVGWAAWNKGVLTSCGQVPFAQFRQTGLRGNYKSAAIEVPDHFAVKTKDVLTLAFRAGVIAGCFEEYETVPVKSWKGSIPKHATARRAMQALTDVETASVESFGDHCWDAIGIGLFVLGRLKR